ncbi:hypothetical protein [Nocardia carnea]|uniref:hypothetical protein n=1 Tax=Nocardia carnea TaxID=37328 RepID=UPI002453C580|nr:hypothetical protein [Nocardia carnea]
MSADLRRGNRLIIRYRWLTRRGRSFGSPVLGALGLGGITVRRRRAFGRRFTFSRWLTLGWRSPFGRRLTSAGRCPLARRHTVGRRLTFPWRRTLSRRLTFTRWLTLSRRLTFTRWLTLGRRLTLSRRSTGRRRARIGSLCGRRRLRFVLIGLVVFAVVLSSFVTQAGHHASHHRERHDVPETAATGRRRRRGCRTGTRARFGAWTRVGIIRSAGIIRFIRTGTEFVRREFTRAETIGPEEARFAAIGT